MPRFPARSFEPTLGRPRGNALKALLMPLIATGRDGSSATVRDGSSATVRDGSSATVTPPPPGDPLFPAMVGRLYITDHPWPGKGSWGTFWGQLCLRTACGKVFRPGRSAPRTRNGQHCGRTKHPDCAPEVRTVGPRPQPGHRSRRRKTLSGLTYDQFRRPANPAARSAGARSAARRHNNSQQNTRPVRGGLRRAPPRGRKMCPILYISYI